MIAVFDPEMPDQVEDICAVVLGREIEPTVYYNVDGSMRLAFSNEHLVASFYFYESSILSISRWRSPRKEIGVTVKLVSSGFAFNRSFDLYFDQTIEIAELLEELKKYSERMDNL